MTALFGDGSHDDPAEGGAYGDGLDAPQRLAAVLLVEDSEATGEVLLEVMRDEGVTAEWARSGEEAILSLAGGAVPRLILVDLFMPGTSGFEVLRVIRDSPQLERVPVLVTTAADRRAIERAREILPRAEPFTKPFDLEALLDRVHREPARVAGIPPGHRGPNRTVAPRTG